MVISFIHLLSVYSRLFGNLSVHRSYRSSKKAANFQDSCTVFVIPDCKLYINSFKVVSIQKEISSACFFACIGYFYLFIFHGYVIVNSTKIASTRTSSFLNQETTDKIHLFKNQYSYLVFPYTAPILTLQL